MTRFLKPVTVASGLLRCEGSIITRGRRTAAAEARLLDESGTLLAHATSTCLIFELPAA
jgi:acyl-coenzyme A thioesterase PaaI-like protein